MAKRNSGNISIANIISLIGFSGIGVITFFGMLFHSSDGTPGVAIVGSVALLAGLIFLLVMSIKAKSAEDNPDKWRYVEWGCLALYVIVAGYFATPFQRFFYIVTEKSDLQAMAQQEIDSIKKMRKSYDYQQVKFLSEAAEQITNYNDSKQIKSIYNNELAEYVKGIGMDVDSWKEKATKLVKLQTDKELSDIAGEIDAWNMMNLASLAAKLEKKDKEAWTSLEKKIREYGENHKLIPVISGGGTQPYHFDGYASFDLGTSPEPRFAQTLRSADGNTVIGWVIYVVLNLLVLLSYVATSRTRFVGPIMGRKTSGMDL